jgi:hypothetical protein
MRKYIVGAVLLSVIIVGIFAAKMYFTKTQNITTLKPDLKISATELINAFDEDPASAHEKFVGKVLLIEGFVDQMESYGEMSSSINFDLKTDYIITFQFDELLPQYYEKDTKLNIKGQYNGYLEADDIFGMPGSILINQSKIEN